MSNVRVHLRVDLGPGRAIGPGKVSLLEALDRSGSLAQAARDLGMSYRRAWLLLKALNEFTGKPVASSIKGGAGGGGATLTAEGRMLIAAYYAVQSAALSASAVQFGAFAPVRASAIDTPAHPRPKTVDASTPSGARKPALR